jgi:predicted NACHT family NTPase
VQVLEGRAARRRNVDLLRALRSDQRSRIFVVLGDPGTGKSVAMRKLARDLLAESSQSARIPIYVNLKEWRTEQPWTVESPPTVAEFYNFLFLNVLQTLDFNSQSFLQQNENFRLLFEAGYLFFVLDSFDEIPAVLDHDENSWLIESLSNCIATCVLGGIRSRAVIASRLFRKPKIVSHERSAYEIRPFSDDRIVQAIHNAANQPDRLTKIVLSERRDLGVIARNPFLLHLIISHYNLTGQAPSAQAEMFETFFQSNIDLARRTFGFAGLSDAQIYAICEDISNTMFNRQNIGLEITDVELEKQIGNPLLREVLRFLAQARIGRVGAVSYHFHIRMTWRYRGKM